MALTNKKLAYIFPGQGSQYQGMGLDFEEKSKKGKELFEQASNIMGQDMKSLLRDSTNDELKKTNISQPAITLVNLVSASYLEEKGIKPSGCAGFSLGEYSALAIAGVISIEDCFKLVKIRGEIMQEETNNITPSGMAAVLGLDPSKVETLISEWQIPDLYPANINSHKQIVISGTDSALSTAENNFKIAGVKRFIRLAVAGPFHSPLMHKASEKFAPVLENIVFHNPIIPLYSNVTGSIVKSGEEAKKLALLHIVKAVRWVEEEKAILENNFEMLLEVGPGKVLQGLWKETGSNIPCLSAGTVSDIDMLLTI